MSASFFLREPPKDKEGKSPGLVEYVGISSGLDVVQRRATDADRHFYKQAYAAFLKSKAPAAKKAKKAKKAK